MEFVWPYFRDGAHGPELELSMRSVQKRFKGLAKLTVIGDYPSEINFAFTFIDCPRIGSTHHHAFFDTFNKLQTAIESDLIAEQFVWMSDDIFFIGEVSPSQLQAGMFSETKSLPDLLDWEPSNSWLLLKKKTLLHLYDSGHRHLMDFDTHAPTLVDAQHVLQITDDHDLKNNALLWQTVYGNTFEGENWKPVNTSTAGFVRITRPLSHFQITQRCKDASILNFTNSAWSKDAEAAVRELINEVPIAGQVATNDSERFPCIGNYRQGTNEVRKHGTCGSRGLIEPVYHCTKYDTKVTINHYNSYQPEKVCKKCDLLNWQPNPVKEFKMEFPLKGYVAVIPYSDRGGRRKGFEYVKNWATEKFETVLTPQQPATDVFNKCKLINQAVAGRADDEILVLLDADSVVTDQQLQDSAQAMQKAPKSIVKPFTDALYLNRDNTERVLEKGHEIKFDQAKRAHRSDGGLTMLRKFQYDAIGGHDERYTEWGWEDTQFIAQARNCGIDVIYIEGSMLHLWHPRNPNRNLQNRHLYRQWSRPAGERDHIPPSKVKTTFAYHAINASNPAFTHLRKFAQERNLHFPCLRSVSQLKRGMFGLAMPAPKTPQETAYFKRANALQVPLMILDAGVFDPKSTFLFTDATDAPFPVFCHGSELKVPDDFELFVQSQASQIVGSEFVNNGDYRDSGSVVVVCESEDIKQLGITTASYASLAESMFGNDICEFYFPNPAEEKSLSGKQLSYGSHFYDICGSAKAVVAASSNYLYRAELAGARAFPLGLHPFLNKTRIEKREILFQILSRTVDSTQPLEDVIPQLASHTQTQGFWDFAVDNGNQLE